MSADETTPPRDSAVLDPEWEVALRAGQQAEGQAGSVEDELAVVHLLRHARAPQLPSEGDLERMWGDIEGGLDEQRAATGWRAWLRRPWLLGGGVAVAAAAAAVIVIVWSGPGPVPDSPGTIARSDAGEALPPEAADMAATIEAQFALLEPGARAAVERTVDLERRSVRDELLASAIAGDGRSMGGAP